MSEFFNAILYQPIFNIFVGLYNLIPDVGLVIVLLTLIIKVVLYPWTKKSIIAQKSLQELQPKLEELKKKHKDDQQTLAQETMKLYKTHKVNPLGSCLPILIQLPIFLALYWVLRDGLTSDNFEQLYPFIANPGHINSVTLGLVDLQHQSIILALFAGGAQYLQAKTLSRRRPPSAAGDGGKDENMMAIMNKQMLYVMPIMTIIIGSQLPGGLALYWLLSTGITAAQQWFLFRNDDTDDSASADKKKKNMEDVVEGKLIS